jgi:hypothetical protein
MRPIAIGLAVALLVAAVAGGEVSAQRGKAAQPDPKAAAEAKARGMAEAPAVAQEAGIACQVVDARLIGENKTTKPAQKFFEIDCAKGLGFILQAKTGEKPSAYTCIDVTAPGADGKPNSLSCTLPGNADMLSELTPMLTKAGVICTPAQVKAIGQTPTNTFMEVACQGGVGYVLQTSAPFDPDKPASAINCLAYDEGNSNIKCTIGDMASRLAIADRYAADAKNGCTVKDRRYIGASQDNSNFFEVSCQDGKGYILKGGTNGALAQTYECAKATNILGGCTLTDAREAATEQAALYTRLSKAAGYNCDVTKYAIFPAPAGKDVVELVCSSGDGGVAIFEGSGKGVVHDCGHALIAGYRCGLNAQSTGYKALTADLRKFDQKSCEVSEARLAAKTTKGTILVEVACADGLKGYMIEYNTNPVSAVGTTNCAFSGNCKLKGNV